MWEVRKAKDSDQGFGLGTWVDGGSFYWDGQNWRMMSSALDMLEWQDSEVEMFSMLLVMQMSARHSLCGGGSGGGGGGGGGGRFRFQEGGLTWRPRVGRY